MLARAFDRVAAVVLHRPRLADFLVYQVAGQPGRRPVLRRSDAGAKMAVASEGVLPAPLSRRRLTGPVLRTLSADAAFSGGPTMITVSGLMFFTSSSAFITRLTRAFGSVICIHST